ncbi:class I SAM-dependent methyltransferase [Mycolicibacterium sphagni]|uniref:Class I SAM-dependent methyltransferase n=1 Tax=Mycolicibacterium sphagni TaxID=1786 RepID=A0ABX2K039_9MYCO|nr:class I SAM-dependent methyltransferase [Mycolicibacterium sphagni]NTY61052.1 class I SAM-dependent methyltransferase [Mycolicibacterium sphagni]
MARFHAEGTADWTITDGVLSLIARHCNADTTSLETGAGASTLAFAAAGGNHTAVTPSQDEVGRIRAEGTERGLDMSRVEFIDGYSQDVLPGLSGPLDFVLIDGGHGFPIPAVDWIYTAQRLNVGGHMLIDDIDVWTGQMLVQFLDKEDEWERVEIVNGITAVFRLVKPFTLREWNHQPAVVQRSRFPRTLRRAKNAARIAARGDFKTLLKKFDHDRELTRAAKCKP